jgi:oligoribonuclease NrnB/cAMP/cGMP phosphodiesterase (DHH superfamily)
MRKIKCFYHNDLDGNLAGDIVAWFCDYYNKEDFFEVNYTDPLPLDTVKDGDEVWFVDYSFTENTCHVLRDLIARGCVVVWIDHHKSSIELIDKYQDLKNIAGIRSNLGCGALLTYIYTNKLPVTILENEQELEKVVPYFIRLVDDYDRWVFKYGDKTTYFKLGMDSVGYECSKPIWNRISEDNRGIILQAIINNGQTIKRYIDTSNAKYLNDYGYETEIRGLKCLAVNKKTNSWIFGDKIKEYPICMVYCFNGEKYTYSIFSQDPNVDCASIAESYGGGGHKNAAGFSSDELLFKRV